MFSKWIKNIRSKPDSVKRGITFGTSLGLTLVIAGFWLVSYLHYSSELLQKKTEHDPVAFLHQIGTEIGDSYANAKERMNSSSLFSLPGASTSDAVEGDGTAPDAGGTVGDSADPSNNSSGGVADGSSVDSSMGASVSSAIDAAADVTADQPASVPAGSSVGPSASFDDILNTKKQVDQGNGATTSSEVLVQ